MWQKIIDWLLVFVILGLLFLISFPNVVLASELKQSYSYGRFTVKVMDDGSQVVVGGIFKPAPEAPVQLKAKHTILANFHTKELTYYRQGENNVEGVLGYSVVTPDPNTLPTMVVRGKVTAIEEDPWWCPTKSARVKYPELPPGCIPPGHVDNAMGAAKFIIDWQLPKSLKDEWQTVRLHGATFYPEGPFWEEETLGCVRLTNDEIKTLIKTLGREAVKEGIEIIFYRSPGVSTLDPF
jgi:lipoprotein-anchoring transpeptidase ErfK/SrfK